MVRSLSPSTWPFKDTVPPQDWPPCHRTLLGPPAGSPAARSSQSAVASRGRLDYELHTREGKKGSTIRLAVAIAVTVLAWGSAFAGIRAALVGYSPTHMALLRYLIASLTLAVYALVVRMPLPRRSDLPGLALVGLVGITFYHTALNYGETTVPAATASFIVASAPVWMAVLGAFFLRERLGARGWVGIIASFAGVGVITLDQAGGLGGLVLGSGGGGTALAWPALAVLGASVASAVYSLGQKPYLRRYSALATAAYIIWTGTAFLLPFAPGLPTAVVRAPLSATLACVYIGVVPGAVGYVTWAYVLSRIPASRAGSFLYFIPLVALVVAWAWLGEVPGPGSLAGGLLVLGGVIMVNAERGGTRPGAARRGDAAERSLLTRAVG
ncbi:MAG: DMT family transporter [Firmicutes bacterium]|nr:DMT family transporter [Bacillota bacterium]